MKQLLWDTAVVDSTEMFQSICTQHAIHIVFPHLFCAFCRLTSAPHFPESNSQAYIEVWKGFTYFRADFGIRLQPINYVAALYLHNNGYNDSQSYRLVTWKFNQNFVIRRKPKALPIAIMKTEWLKNSMPLKTWVEVHNDSEDEGVLRYVRSGGGDIPLFRNDVKATVW